MLCCHLKLWANRIKTERVIPKYVLYDVIIFSCGKPIDRSCQRVKSLEYMAFPINSGQTHTQTNKQTYTEQLCFYCADYYVVGQY